METEISQEMRLFSPSGERLYLNGLERKQFLAATSEEEPIQRMFCSVLCYTGCRPSEALELTPERILIEEQALVFRSLKKRKVDSKGRIKQPQYRTVQVPQEFIEKLDLVFGIRAIQKRGKDIRTSFWSMSRSTAYRIVKRVMKRAGIKGKQATSKGLRHAYGVGMVSAKKPLPIHILSQLMGHSDTKTTEVYLQVVGEEKRQMVIAAWEE